MIRPEMIDAALQPLLSEPAVQCTNIAARIRTDEELRDRNTIKVVMRKDGDALFMSREPIPTRTRLPFARMETYKQVCVIPFPRDFLLTYAQLPPTDLEHAESIDMLPR